MNAEKIKLTEGQHIFGESGIEIIPLELLRQTTNDMRSKTMSQYHAEKNESKAERRLASQIEGVPPMDQWRDKFSSARVPEKFEHVGNNGV